MNHCHKLLGLLALGLFALMPAAVSAQEIKKADIDGLRTEIGLLHNYHKEQMKLTQDQLAEMRSRITALELKADTLQKAQVRTSFAPPVVGSTVDEIKRSATFDDVLLELKLLRQANEVNIDQVKQFRDEVASLRQRVAALEQKADTLRKAHVRTSFAPP